MQPSTTMHVWYGIVDKYIDVNALGKGKTPKGWLLIMKTIDTNY
jgi:hypothetical protein